MEKQIIQAIVDSLPEEFREEALQKINSILKDWKINHKEEVRLIKKLSVIYALHAIEVLSKISRYRKGYNALPHEMKDYNYIASPEIIQDPIKYVNFVIKKLNTFFKSCFINEKDPFQEIIQDLKFLIRDMEYVQLNIENILARKDKLLYINSKLIRYFLPIIFLASGLLYKKSGKNVMPAINNFLSIFSLAVQSNIDEIEEKSIDLSRQFFSFIALWELQLDQEIIYIDEDSRAIAIHKESEKIRSKILELKKFVSANNHLIVEMMGNRTVSKSKSKAAKNGRKNNAIHIAAKRKLVIDFWLKPNPETGEPWKKYTDCVRAYERLHGQLPREEKTVTIWLSEFDKQQKK